jgi:cardiolipin synthase
MRAAGIRVLIFNPVNPAKAKGNWDLNNRNHRKLMVVDGKVAFTGGINISSDYANSSLFRSRQKPDNVDKRQGRLARHPRQDRRARPWRRCSGPS